MVTKTQILKTIETEFDSIKEVYSLSALKNYMMPKIEENLSLFEKAIREETAIKIVKGIQVMENVGNIAECNCGCPKAITWAIMRGWGIEPEELQNKKA